MRQMSHFTNAHTVDPIKQNAKNAKTKQEIAETGKLRCTVVQNPVTY